MLNGRGRPRGRPLLCTGCSTFAFWPCRLTFPEASVTPTPFIRLAAATLLAATITRSAEAQHLTIGPSLPATSPFLGGVPQGAATTSPVFISIGDAIKRALAYNLGVLEAEERVDRAHSARRSLQSSRSSPEAGIPDRRRVRSVSKTRKDDQACVGADASSAPRACRASGSCVIQFHC